MRTQLMICYESSFYLNGAVYDCSFFRLINDPNSRSLVLSALNGDLPVVCYLDLPLCESMSRHFWWRSFTSYSISSSNLSQLGKLFETIGVQSSCRVLIPFSGFFVSRFLKPLLSLGLVAVVMVMCLCFWVAHDGDAQRKELDVLSDRLFLTLDSNKSDYYSFLDADNQRYPVVFSHLVSAPFVLKTLRITSKEAVCFGHVSLDSFDNFVDYLDRLKSTVSPDIQLEFTPISATKLGVSFRWDRT